MSPLGEILAGPLHDMEGLLFANIDSDDCERGKFDLDVVGHYARSDVFDLRVDTAGRTAVTFNAPLKSQTISGIDVATNDHILT